MVQDPHIHVHDEDEPKQSKARLFVRITVIALMIIALFFIAVAIVRYVPKFISSFGQANVSLTSLFRSNTSSTTPTINQTNQSNNQGAGANNYANNNTPRATTTPSAPGQNNQSQTEGTRPTGTYTAPRTYQTYSTYTGPTDVSINLIKVGRILADGTFQSTSNLQAGDRVIIQFNVSNVGSSRSGAWTLSAILPTSITSEQNYVSGTQPALNPGDTYQMTLAFDSFDPSKNSILISINSADSNQGNNVLTIPVTGSGTGPKPYPNPSNCYWYNGQYICGTGGTTYNGPADLAVTITNVGYMDQYSGQFYSGSSLYGGQKIAVQFEVRNVGGTNSSTWSFNANLPSSYQSNYYSGLQNSLAPGQVQTFTLGFTNAYSGSQSFTVELNPQGSDSNGSNNYASRTLYIGY